VEDCFRPVDGAGVSRVKYRGLLLFGIGYSGCGQETTLCANEILIWFVERTSCWRCSMCMCMCAIFVYLAEGSTLLRMFRVERGKSAVSDYWMSRSDVLGSRAIREKASRGVNLGLVLRELAATFILAARFLRSRSCPAATYSYHPTSINLKILIKRRGSITDLCLKICIVLM